MNPLYSVLAGLLVLVAVFAFLASMSDEGSRRNLGIRDKLIARHRAHPKLMNLWCACTTGALALLLTALVTWLA